MRPGAVVPSRRAVPPVTAAQPAEARRPPGRTADTLGPVPAEQIARNLAFVSLTLLATLAVGSFGAPALAAGPCFGAGLLV